MSRLHTSPLPVAVVTAIATGVALLLPWARYGGIDVRVYDLPGWLLYAVLAAGQVAAVVVGTRIRGRGGQVAAMAVALLLAAGTVAAAVWFMAASLDPAVVFGSVVPPITPALATGGVVAIVAGVAGGAAAVLVGRRAVRHGRAGAP
jgi:hypothetical protein